jgi:hypothetical protein
VSKHPSEDFVATFLTNRGWATTQNVRVKLDRNWSDIDVFAVPTAGAEVLPWQELPAGSLPTLPLVIEVKYRGVFAWDLSAATARQVMSYFWPARRRRVLQHAARLAGGSFDVAVVTTQLWMPERSSALQRLEGEITAKLQEKTPEVSSVRFVTVEELAAEWAQHTLEQGAGWTDDPFSFLLRVLAQARLLDPARVASATFASQSGLASLSGMLSDWGADRDMDITAEGPLSPAYEYLRALAVWCDQPGAEPTPYSEEEWRGIYVIPQRDVKKWFGLLRHPRGKITFDVQYNRSSREEVLLTDANTETEGRILALLAML